MTEKRRRSRPSHFPLTIDPWGGVLKTSGEGRNREINFSLRGEGGLRLIREIDGADWRISSGEGRGRMDIQALEDSLTVSCLLPFMVLEYSRGGGFLQDILISGVDIAALAGTKIALERGDWGNVEDLKQFGEDRLFSLRFTEDGLAVVCAETTGREVVGAVAEDEENLETDSYGFLPEAANYTWRGDLGFLKGRVGFEVFPDKVSFFYGRQRVMEVPRTVRGVANFDWQVTQGLPSEDDLVGFMEEVYWPLL